MDRVAFWESSKQPDESITTSPQRPVSTGPKETLVCPCYDAASLWEPMRLAKRRGDVEVDIVESTQPGRVDILCYPSQLLVPKREKLPGIRRHVQTAEVRRLDICPTWNGLLHLLLGQGPHECRE